MNRRINPLTFRQLWSPDDGQGAGDGAGDPPPDGAGQPGPPPNLPPDAASGLRNLWTRNDNDAGAVAVLLYDENRQYRETIRQLREQIPPDGAVILTEETDLEAWNKHAELAEELEAANARIADQERRQAISQAAQAAGFNERVLSGLLAQGAEPAVLATQETDGEQLATIQIGEQGDPIPLADYAAEHWQDYMPALKPDERPTGTPYPGQAGSSGQPSGGENVAERFLQRVTERAETGNALRPAANKEQ